MRLLLILAPLPAFAQEAETVPYLDLSQRQQIGVIRGLIESGQFEEAQFLLANSVFDEGDYGYQAAYLQAILWRIEGRTEDAAALLRQILDERPEFRLVRLELAQLLIATGQREGAEFHLTILADNSETAGEREQFERVIDAVSPDDRLSFSSFLTIAPSTNVTNGSSTDTIILNGLPFRVTNKEESGVGLSFGGTAVYTVPLAEQRQLYFAGAAQVNEFSGGDFDNQIATVRAGIHFGPVTRRATVELVRDRRWVAEDENDNGLGLRLAANRSFGDGQRIETEYSYIDREFENAFDQVSQQAEVTYRRALDSRQGISVGLFGELLDSETSATSYDALGVRLGAYRSFSNGVLLNADLEYSERHYRGVNGVIGTERQDEIFRARISGLSNRITFRGVTPRVGLTYTNFDSNLPITSFDALGAELTLTRRF
ncbi:porin family protein [Roseobacter sp. HKCCA0434]|uniref:porin family protein n=1 Tax=Roseobacter sp. HKCCA0434 TaxID=3079297 RepID=UPI002905CADA|nr:porin family protein [Roseobacter sp. HKCCA0434]